MWDRSKAHNSPKKGCSKRELWQRQRHKQRYKHYKADKGERVFTAGLLLKESLHKRVKCQNTKSVYKPPSLGAHRDDGSPRGGSVLYSRFWMAADLQWFEASRPSWPARQREPDVREPTHTILRKILKFDFFIFRNILNIHLDTSQHILHLYRGHVGETSIRHLSKSYLIAFL